jgi:hypothetical protein
MCVKSYMRVWQWWCILERPALFCFRPLDPAWSCNQPLDSTLKELRAAVAQLLLHACSAGFGGGISLFSIAHQFSLSLLPTMLQQQHVIFRLQSISISFLSFNQHHHSILNHFRIQFVPTNLRKQSNFIWFKILERYIKLENINYIIDWKGNYIIIK